MHQNHSDPDADQFIWFFEGATLKVIIVYLINAALFYTTEVLCVILLLVCDAFKSLGSFGVFRVVQCF